MPNPRSKRPRRALMAAALCLGFWPGSAAPLDVVELRVSGARDLRELVEGASLLWAGRKNTAAPTVDVFADAQADYARLIEALYAAGHFAAVISIRLDGREAAGIAPLDAPETIRRVEVIVDPGPRFTFLRAEIQPLPGRVDLPPGFSAGQTATTGAIREAVETGIESWRNRGHAKAAVMAQDIVANHADSTLSASIDLEPGPKLRYGEILVTGNDRMRTNRVRKIAGLDQGDPFSARDLERAADRLRRTGIFSAVAIEESETIVAPDLLSLTLNVVEAKTRRYSFGLEASSLDGVKMSGDWLHRNLFGGGERFNIGFEVRDISSSLSGTDYAARIAIERPASFFPDTTGGIALDLERLDEPDYTLRSGDLAVNFNHVFSAELSAGVGLGYSFVTGADDLGDFTYRSLNLPLGLTWDRRDKPTDATRRFFVDAEVKPFLGFGDTDNGTRLTFDARGYLRPGAGEQFVLAARVQGGAILGASPLGAPRDELFYSGGGGTVRGQPYRSLGITVETADGPVEAGGTTFLGGSLEGRTRINETWGAVAFLDVGAVGEGGLDGIHSGAGVGVRYQTGFGPLRLDLAVPVGGGSGGTGAQVYVGLGQAF